MAKTKIEDILPSATFGLKLFKLGEKIECRGAAAIAEALYNNNDCFHVISPRGRSEKYKTNKRKDVGAIMRRVQDHLNLQYAYEVPSKYLYAYSILFNCSMDFLYGKIDQKCPNLEILDISQKTGLSINASSKLVECSKDGESPVVMVWSAILDSELYESIPHDWCVVKNSISKKMDSEGKLEGLKWAKKYLQEKNINSNDIEMFDSPIDIDREIDSLEEDISLTEASFYGTLSKMSKNFADFTEGNMTRFYESSREEAIEIWTHFYQRSYQWIE